MTPTPSNSTDEADEKAWFEHLQQGYDEIQDVAVKLQIDWQHAAFLLLLEQAVVVGEMLQHPITMVQPRRREPWESDSTEDFEN